MNLWKRRFGKWKPVQFLVYFIFSSNFRFGLNHFLMNNHLLNFIIWLPAIIPCFAIPSIFNSYNYKSFKQLFAKISAIGFI